MLPDRATYERLRMEYNRPSFKRMLREKLGDECRFCKTKENLEFHHLIALWLGGNNELENIVRVCPACHDLLHRTRDIRNIAKSPNSGRHKMTPIDGYEDILNSYLTGDIGRKECQELLQFKPQMKLADWWAFKEYKEEYKIASYKNRIDLFNCDSNKRDAIAISDKFIVPHKQGNTVVAEIVYENGDKFIRYNDCSSKIIKSNADSCEET